MSSGNPHLERDWVLAGPPAEEARAAAVVLHGRDQDPDYMLEHLVARLGTDDVAYWLPSAAGNAWYPGRFSDPREVNEPWMEHSLDACEAAVAQLLAADTEPDRIVLAGFSQGACVVADFLALRPRAFAGVALLTGTLTGPEGDETPVAPLGGVPVFVTSSEHDDWIPPEHVRATARALEAAGGEVQMEITGEREHGISDVAVRGVRALLDRIGPRP